MLEDLRHIELVKLALTHLCEILHTKLDSALADFMLMPFAQITLAQIWADPMHRAVPKKVPRLQFG
jgi:hypothetical protein